MAYRADNTIILSVREFLPGHVKRMVVRKKVCRLSFNIPRRSYLQL